MYTILQTERSADVRSHIAMVLALAKGRTLSTVFTYYMCKAKTVLPTIWMLWCVTSCSSAHCTEMLHEFPGRIQKLHSLRITFEISCRRNEFIVLLSVLNLRKPYVSYHCRVEKLYPFSRGFAKLVEQSLQSKLWLRLIIIKTLFRHGC